MIASPTWHAGSHTTPTPHPTLHNNRRPAWTDQEKKTLKLLFQTHKQNSYEILALIRPSSSQKPHQMTNDHKNASWRPVENWPPVTVNHVLKHPHKPNKMRNTYTTRRGVMNILLQKRQINHLKMNIIPPTINSRLNLATCYGQAQDKKRHQRNLFYPTGYT